MTTPFIQFCNNNPNSGNSLCVFEKVQRFPQPFTYRGDTILLKRGVKTNKSKKKQCRQCCQQLLNPCYNEKFVKLPLPIELNNEIHNKPIIDRYKNFFNHLKK